MELELPNKNFFFFNIYTIDIFLFVTERILLLVTTIVMSILCKHTILKTLVPSLALQADKRNRCSNQTGRCHTEYRMYL